MYYHGSVLFLLERTRNKTVRRKNFYQFHDLLIHSAGSRMLRRVLFISSGVFVGGGAGFYFKENYYLRMREKKRAELEEELRELVEIRRKKEHQLQSREFKS